jgi:predicted amidophosphoribosyltransferase
MPYQRRTRLCDACQASIGHIVRIKCHVCEDVELCVECFAQGKEFDKHKATHSYRVMASNMLYVIYIMLIYLAGSVNFSYIGS